MTCGRRPALAWLWAAVTGLVLAAVATVLGPADPGLATAAAPAGCQAWAGAPLPGEQGAFGLFGMTVLSPCDAWVVGDQSAEVAGGEVGVTLTEHWNGAAWTVV